MIFISVCFNRFGYPRSAPSILYDILVGANLIVVLSHPFYVYRLVYPYFKINRYTFCRNFFGNLGLQLFCIAYLSFTTQKRLKWLFECQVEWLKLVRPVMRNWYHIAIMFSIKIFTLSVHCPLNTSAIKSHFLVERRSSSSFLFLP